MSAPADLAAETRLAAVLAQIDAAEARLRAVEARLRAAEHRLAKVEPGSQSALAKRRPLRDYVHAAARAAGVTPERLVGAEKRWPVARPRMAAMALAIAETGASLSQVARAFGGRDHTTVSHALRRATEPDLTPWLARVAEELDRRAAS